MKRINWSQSDVNTLIDLYPDHSGKEIAAILNCSVTRVYFKANKLGLKKSEQFNLSVKSGRILQLSTTGAALRFQPGQEAWNKGKSMEEYASEDFISKFRGTQFRKGNKPRNFKPIGSKRIDIDGYRQTKVDNCRKWAFDHRLIWEAANGPIPENMNVMFLDGNRLNCELTNLVLKTKAECMRQNTIRRYPEDLQQTIKILAKCERHIRKDVLCKDGF